MTTPANNNAGSQLVRFLSSMTSRLVRALAPQPARSAGAMG
ncbi:MAG TPA: hypothetical protein VIT62_10085 [Lysobacter sp.]|jgi:hypothetical protein